MLIFILNYNFLLFRQFNHFYTFSFGLFAEFIGFAVVFVIGDYEIRVFYDVMVPIIIQQPVSNHQRQVDFQEHMKNRLFLYKFQAFLQESYNLH